MAHKKLILKHTAQMAGTTMISRLLGIVRELLMVEFLGASALSDAFLTAFKIPNSLRKVFAEGALSAALVPTLVKTVRHDGKQGINRMMTLSFLTFEGLVLLLCGLVVWKAEVVVRAIAPGFSETQILNTAPLLQILMPFILFISSSALLAGAMQAVGNFVMAAASSIILNTVFVLALLACLKFGWPVTAFCWLIIAGGLLQFICHVSMYFKLHFNFASVTWKDIQAFWPVLGKFLLCLPSVSVVEISIFIDTSFASFLPAGSISLIHYANRFVGIPLGVFAVAFSTILLPYFSRIGSYAPRRLSFFVLESAKLIFWVTIPATLLMIFFAQDIFKTIFLSSKFSMVQVVSASHILMMCVLGLFFLSLNKILLNVYYSLHNTLIPALISMVATSINIALNFLVLRSWGAVGLALATNVSLVVQTLLFLIVLNRYFHFPLYIRDWMRFVKRFLLQLAVMTALFLFLFYGAYTVISSFNLPPSVSRTLLHGIGFWIWVSPIVALCSMVFFITRRYFGVRLYFLDE
jgi:putative peptidoglycan lipid II flippase